ncbi:MAG: HIT family protein [Thermoguttaceae bacterium]
MGEQERIWAPWRLSYVQATDKQPTVPSGPLQFLPGANCECFICQAVADHDDRGRLVVARGHVSLTILNRYPYNNGHLLVAPHRHVADLQDLLPSEHLEMAETIARQVDLLRAELQAEGFNVGLNLGRVGGAGLPGHLHWHVVPRWNGDTNFMPVLAAVKVIPQSLDSLWQLLSNRLSQ